MYEFSGENLNNNKLLYIGKKYVFSKVYKKIVVLLLLQLHKTALIK